MKTFLNFLFFLIFSTTCQAFQFTGEYSNEEIDARTSENKGKCFAKCMVPFENSEEENQGEPEIIAAYTGSNMKTEGVELQMVMIEPAGTRWVKKTAERDCFSRDPNDCLVWCLVEMPAEYKNIYVVTDTSIVKEFVMRTISLPKSNVKRRTGWFEVLCDKEINTTFNTRLELALKNKGYSRELTNLDLRGRLISFQRDNNLPIGNYNVLTMQALGLR
jgi:hypothetical protein